MLQTANQSFLLTAWSARCPTRCHLEEWNACQWDCTLIAGRCRGEPPEDTHSAKPARESVSQCIGFALRLGTAHQCQQLDLAKDDTARSNQNWIQHCRSQQSSVARCTSAFEPWTATVCREVCWGLLLDLIRPQSQLSGRGLTRRMSGVLDGCPMEQSAGDYGEYEEAPSHSSVIAACQW